MFLRRIFKGMPNVGPWLAVAEMVAALATVYATLVALHVAPSPFGATPAGIVSGIVTSVKTGKPIPEATVQIVDTSSMVIAAESQPDAQGKWKETVKPGNYKINALCDGYAPAAKTVSVAAAKERIVNLTIRPQTAAETQNQAATAAAPQPAPQTPRTVYIEPAANGGSSRPQAAVAASGSSEMSDKEKAAVAQFEKAMKLAKSNNEDAAIAALENAVVLDSSDGRYWCLLLQLLEQSDKPGARASAQGYMKDADMATKNLDGLKVQLKRMSAE